MILEEKRAKEAKEKHENEEIETRKKEEQSAKVKWICKRAYRNSVESNSKKWDFWNMLIQSFQIAAVKDFLKKRGDERYGELQKGVLLSETFAQMEENDLIK